jgi:hypothetical protein
LAAFSNAEKSKFPTPTIEAEGRVYELRDTAAGILALAALNEFPTLLSLKGFAQTRSKKVLEFERASEADVSAWERSASSSTVETPTFKPDDITGRWTLKTLYAEHVLHFQRDNWIIDATGAIAGRWFARQDGVQLVGLPGLVFALADQFRLTRGVWRLSGWGWLSMKDSVTFSLARSE